MRRMVMFAAALTVVEGMTVAGSKHVPVRDTPEYIEAQSDERFRSWVLMQDAVMDLEFIFEVPELKSHLYSREGLMLAEKAALERFTGWREAFSGENLTLAMRFVYFVGETFRRHLDGQWVAVPQQPPKKGALQEIDVAFISGFYNPIDMLQMALAQRTGDKIVKVFDHAVNRHQKWVTEGRPLRSELP